MRAHEFLFLNETGLAHAQIAKDYGNYLDQLINFIAKGEKVELEGPSIKKYGNFVKFKKQDATKLSQVYYGQNKIPDDKSKLSVHGQRNHIIPAGNYKNLRLTIQGTKNTVPLGDVLKSAKFKSGKGFNAGDVGEAFLGAAATAKFLKGTSDINEDDVKNVFRSMKVTDGAKNKMGEVWAEIVMSAQTQAEGDALHFKLVLNRTSFTSIEKAIKEDIWHPKMIGLNRSAIEWANKNPSVKKAIEIVDNDGNKNEIAVMSDGTMDQKGTKADLFLTIDGSTINLLSLKAGDVKQFGQESGNTYEIFHKYFQNIFGVDIPDTWIDQLSSDDGKANYPILQKIYKEVYNELQNELAGNTKKEVAFIERLYKGITHHATRNDPAVTMVILKDTPTKPGYKELGFGPELYEAMKQFDLRITHQQNPPRILIYGVPVGTDAKQQLTGKELLVQIRSNLKGDTAKGYLRNLIEMGDLLKYVAAVKQDLEHTSQEPIKPVSPMKTAKPHINPRTNYYNQPE
jgi:hypothetical protein